MCSNKLRSARVVGLAFVLGAAVPALARAQWQKPDNPGLPGDDLVTILGNIIKSSLALVAVVALAFVVYGGFRYIASRGDEREVETAKNIVTYAVLGIMVIGIAWALVSFVLTPFLGGGGGSGSLGGSFGNGSSGSDF